MYQLYSNQNLSAEYLTIIPRVHVGCGVLNNKGNAEFIIITSYPTRANEIIVLLN